MSTEDGGRSGRPKEVATDENIKNIHKMILNGGKLKLNDKADILKISTKGLHHIIHKYLGMRKLCAMWVPRELTFDQKQRRVDDSEQCSSGEDDQASLRRPIDSHPSGKTKRRKTQHSAGKVMASVYLDAHGIFIKYLEKVRTINSNYYIAFLDRLKDEIAAFEEKESAVSARKFTVSLVSENDSKNP
ncbi:hypothetical protein GWI33_010197 [Rhynchophorus ferrugineus]|uniref:Histone-lysine N-methyltransferase SETMAR n=1 Tax=Rhynchophorus ferrugineus TaxID=354439 RepID=A0A834J201_RHYFE|nr:hypothetical protein GWI33_010197 [Rhynchophorus ferrugineus]